MTVNNSTNINRTNI